MLKILIKTEEDYEKNIFNFLIVCGNLRMRNYNELINKLIVGTSINLVSEVLEYQVKPIIGNYVKQHEVLYNAFYNAFTDFTSENVKVNGTKNILMQPEFNDADKIRDIIYQNEFWRKYMKFDFTNLKNNLLKKGYNVSVFATKEELLDYAMRSGAPMEVVENLQEMEDEGEVYESIEEIWPDYPSKEDFFFDEEEY